MRPTLTEPQVAALREIAGLEPPRRRKPWPQTLKALSAKGLLHPDGTATGLGRVAARMKGWVPSEAQQELIVALAEGPVIGSVRYHLSGQFARAPATVLNRFADAGLATQRSLLPGGRISYAATSLCHELALDLRQQELPPPLWVRGGR